MKLVRNSIDFLRHRYPKATKVFVLTLLAILGFALFTVSKPTPQSGLATPLPQDPAIKVYFNHNPSAQYQDPYRHFVRKGDNLEQQIIDAINQAQSTIDVAVMEFRLPKVAEALIAKQKAGVNVRLMIDNKYNKAIADYSPTEIAHMNRHDKQAYQELQRYPADALALVRESGIAIKDDAHNTTKGRGLMHHKFVLVDGKTTIISSANMTTSDMHGDFNAVESRGNPNNMVVVANNAELTKAFSDEFNYMWQGLFKTDKPQRPAATIPVGQGTITVNFSPTPKAQAIETTSNGIIAHFIEQVTKSIHLALFVFSDQNISDTLGKTHDKGVEDIKLLIDPDFYQQPYSKAYDALGVCPASGKRTKTAHIKPWQSPITTVGFPTGPTGDRGVHSKMAILDRRLVITGSHNWSSSANYLNDETLVFIDNPTVAAHYEREFSRLYETAVVGLQSLPHAQKCHSSTSVSPTVSSTSTELEPFAQDN